MTDVTPERGEDEAEDVPDGASLPPVIVAGGLRMAPMGAGCGE